MTLKPFGDRDVSECAVQITNTGDGLSAALEVDPVELAHGDTVYVVLKGTVTKVSYAQVKDSDELRRVHTIRTTFGTIVDEPGARKALDGARRKIEHGIGVHRIPGTDDHADE